MFFAKFQRFQKPTDTFLQRWEKNISLMHRPSYGDQRATKTNFLKIDNVIEKKSWSFAQVFGRRKVFRLYLKSREGCRNLLNLIHAVNRSDRHCPN